MSKEFSDRFIDELVDLIKVKGNESAENSYTALLLKDSINRVSQKVGEEAVEVVVAALNDTKEELVSETCDLIFHLLVLLEKKGVSLEDLRREFSNRNHETLDVIRK